MEFHNLSKSPTIRRITSGSGTYNTPSGVKFLKIKMVGGGGGGGGSGYSTVGSGGNGGHTTFGTSLLSANGGNGNSGGIPSGGSVTINSPATSICEIPGAPGSGKAVAFNTDVVGIAGAMGGVSPFGGAGHGGPYNGNGTAAQTNSGSGGGGAGGQTTIPGNVDIYGGGAAGGYLEALISNPASSYSYSVGTAGAASTGSDQANGGAGGSGVIIIEEYYS